MNNLANVFGLISHFFWRKTDNIILRAGQFLRVGNSQLKDDKLGIGTTSPAYDLHLYDADGTCWIEVEAGLAGVLTGIGFKNPNQRWLIYNDGTSGNRLRIRNATGSANVFTVLTSNEVGIMTNDPDASLHVAKRMRSTGGLGWFCSKTGVAHNTATDIAKAVYSAGTTGSFLVTVNLFGTGRVASKVFTVSSGWTTTSVFEMSAALYGFTGLTLAAAMVTETRTLTLTVTQTNAGSEAVTVQMMIQPLSVGGDSYTAAFTAL